MLNTASLLDSVDTMLAGLMISGRRVRNLTPTYRYSNRAEQAAVC